MRGNERKGIREVRGNNYEGSRKNYGDQGK